MIIFILNFILVIESMTTDSLEPQPFDDQKIIATVHDPYDVACIPPKGLPQPKMWWEDPKGHVINDSGRIHVEDMRLTFLELQEADAGKYTCMAENLANKRSISFSLVVSGRGTYIFFLLLCSFLL